MGRQKAIQPSGEYAGAALNEQLTAASGSELKQSTCELYGGIPNDASARKVLRNVCAHGSHLVVIDGASTAIVDAELAAVGPDDAGFAQVDKERRLAMHVIDHGVGTPIWPNQFV